MEPATFTLEGPWHVRVFPAFDVLLGSPARKGASRVGGRVGFGVSYAVLPELDVGLELDLLFGLGWALDVAPAMTYRWALSTNWWLAAHAALGYFQILTGAADPAFLLRGSADIGWTIAPGYSLYFAPASFALIAGETVAGLYEVGVGFLGSF